MMFILFMLMMTLTILFTFTTHPISMGLILMLQTMLTSMITGSMMMTFWYSYVLFMIMIGGMLVLLLYMTSVASNKKFKFSWKMMTTSLTTASIIMIMLTMNNYILNMMFVKPTNLEISIWKYFNLPNSTIMIMLIIYLLITLIAIVKITKTNSGTLRQK